MDPGMAAGLMNGLAKIGGNANNHRALVRSGSIGLGVALMAYHPDDLHVCETVLMLLLPFSFNLEITRLMSEAGAVPVLVAAMVSECMQWAFSSAESRWIVAPPHPHPHPYPLVTLCPSCGLWSGPFPSCAFPTAHVHVCVHGLAWRVQEQHVSVLTPRYGAPMKGEPKDAEGERVEQATNSPHSARLLRREPRIVQICVQCIANLACDENDVGETTVDKIVKAGAVRVMGVVRVDTVQVRARV
jgi:hypothetical protein